MSNYSNNKDFYPRSISLSKGMNCIHCGGNIIRNKDQGVLICTICGNVIVRYDLEEGPEWRSFEEEEESRVRVGPPSTPLVQDKGFSTLLGVESDDSAKGIVGKAKRDMSRLRKWQHRISFSSSKGRNLSVALSILGRIGEKLEVPLPVLSRASHLYRMALEKDMLRGRAIDPMIGAALYAALRLEGMPRTLKELSEASSIEEKELAGYYRLLIKELDLRVPVADPIVHVRGICARANLSKKIMLETEKIVRLAQINRLTAGKSPAGLAGASTYYACTLHKKNHTSYREIAYASETSEVTIRNIYKILTEKLALKEPVTLEILRETEEKKQAYLKKRFAKNRKT